MKLNLKNPIVFFDLETTGTNINSDRIVEICYLKVYPNGNEESKTMRINPEMPIPAEASAVHGIYDADIADCPTFKEVARNIANDIEGCDLAGFNSNRFDIPVQFKLRDLGQQEFRAEALRLPAHCFGQVRAAGALHPGIVDHLGRNRDLPAEPCFLHNQYTVTRTRQI